MCDLVQARSALPEVHLPHAEERSGFASGALFESVENRYTTSFLLTVNDAWQDQVARLSEWAVPGFPRQVDFYRDQAAEFRRRDQKVVVIISDALRYEVAEECLREIRKLNRFDAELKPMIGAAKLHAAGDGGASAERGSDPIW